MQRVTCIIPTSLVAEANEVFYLMGSALTKDSVVKPSWEDIHGNLYSVTSGLWNQAQVEGIANPNIIADLLEEEDSRITEDIDLDLVISAQSATKILDISAEELAEVSNNLIQIFVSNSPLGTLSSLGLSRINEEEE